MGWDGSHLPTVIKFTLAAHLPLSVFYGTLPAKVELKKSHFGKEPRLECAPSHIACQREFAEAPRVGNTPEEYYSQRCISEEARNTYSELAIRHEGIDAGIIGLRSLKFKRCAELDGAARLRLTFALVSSVRPNRYSTEERHSQVKMKPGAKPLT